MESKPNSNIYQNRNRFGFSGSRQRESSLKSIGQSIIGGQAEKRYASREGIKPARLSTMSQNTIGLGKTNSSSRITQNRAIPQSNKKPP